MQQSPESDPQLAHTLHDHFQLTLLNPIRLQQMRDLLHTLSQAHGIDGSPPP